MKYTIPGDATLDGSVDIFDLNRLLANYNRAGGWAQGDFNYDGKIDIFDLNSLLANYNKSAGFSVSAAEVPEPATGLAWVTVGALVLARRKRRGC